MLLKNNFSGGTDGAGITPENSGGVSGDAFTSVSGVPTYTTANVSGQRGPMAAILTSAGSVRWSYTLSGRDVWARAYIWLTGYPSSFTDFFITLRGASSDLTQLCISTTGKLSIRKSGASPDQALQTGSVPLNQWVRVEFSVHIGTTTSDSTCEIRRYDSADAAAASWSERTQASAIDLGTIIPVGIAFWRASGGNYEYDDVAVTDVGWLGPASFGAQATPSVLTGTWSLPTLTISTGSGIAPSTLTGTWTLPDPEIATANGLTPVNPNTLAGTWALPAPTVQAYSNITVTPETLVGAWQVYDPVAGVPVNPGDGISGPGQVEWNGFLFGPGTPYTPQQLDGWVTDMPGLDSGNVPQPSRHGSYPGRKLAQERQVTLSGLITANPGDIEQAIEDLIQATPVLEDDVELPLAIRVLNNVYVGYGSVTRRSIPLDMVGIGKAKLTIQWTLSDPVLLSQSLSSAVIADAPPRP
ncbi:hypothetical protein [Microbispora sp. GKU 823]|uniref:hypothetical protein n=1 Tax=Microbispora sp. GKU 823 TaxID=1652100 RepID=UPI0009A44CFC|nr:hypothetical protein [Microbispora sp. GKU 823]OPG10563.1 hypothetical protein B1L11_23165 [Microbispora sp. GKU 823]